MNHENNEHIIRRINIFFTAGMPIFLYVFDTLKSSEQNGCFFSFPVFGEVGSISPAVSPFYTLSSPLFIFIKCQHL